jgi:hypothetical protein
MEAQLSAHGIQDSARGNVTHDSRGTAFWDWAVETGVLAKKSVAELITTLHEPGSLALEAEMERIGEWAGDPYNRPAR